MVTVEMVHVDAVSSCVLRFPCVLWGEGGDCGYDGGIHDALYGFHGPIIDETAEVEVGIVCVCEVHAAFPVSVFSVVVGYLFVYEDVVVSRVGRGGVSWCDAACVGDDLLKWHECAGFDSK